MRTFGSPSRTSVTNGLVVGVVLVASVVVVGLVVVVVLEGAVARPSSSSSPQADSSRAGADMTRPSLRTLRPPFSRLEKQPRAGFLAVDRWETTQRRLP